VQRSLEIAADICVFTNRQISILELPETVKGEK
jgi:ATP-dependent protease HslVU (ClpYQ) peptidase subunit